MENSFVELPNLSSVITKASSMTAVILSFDQITIALQADADDTFGDSIFQ